MHVDLVTTTEGLTALADEWEDLERRDPHATYYMSYRFLSAWWDAFADKPGVDLRVVTVRQNGRLVAVAPLALREESRKQGTVRVLGWAGGGDYLAPLLDPAENTDSVCKDLLAFVEARTDWDVLTLGNVPATSPFSAFLLRSPHNPSYTLHVENPYLDLRPYADFESFAETGLPSKVRKYRNKLFREHDVRFRVIRGNEDGIFDKIAALHRLEKEFLVQEAQRTERYSLFEDPFRGRHLRSVFDRTSDAVTFAYETKAGDLIGYRTCFLHGRTLLSWNSAYHPDYADARIGKVIQFDIVKAMFDDDIADVFDFGAGRYQWKFEWTDTFTSTYRLRLRRSAGESSPPPRKKAPAGKPLPRPIPPPAPTPSLGRRVARRLGVGRARDLARRSQQTLVRRTRPPIIWYIPHPDDETIFMGGSIAQTQHRRNILVMLTRGGASGALAKVNAKLPRHLDVEEFMQARIREFHAAAHALGVRAKDVVVHDLPDGSLDLASVREVIAEMARRYPGASHRTMSYLDPHRDHATAGRALRAAHADGEVEDATFHLPIPLVDESLGRRVPLDPAVAVPAKQAALREYRHWDPDNGRYGIGSHSVTKLIQRQFRAPVERVHGPGYEAAG